MRARTAMPDGVFPPETMAKSVLADVRSREESERHQLWLAPHQPTDEMRLRARLMTGARKGNRRAIADLWRLYRCWLTVGEAARR